MAHPPKQRKVIDIKAVGDAEGKVYPRSVDGPFTRWRWVFVWLTQLVFYGLCWIPWDGRQAVLFDLDARKFYLFDLVLWPQDTIYLVMLMIVGALALFLFTAVAGRLWCGYSCPQTVYTEIFLWIEKRIEGERPRRVQVHGLAHGVDRRVDPPLFPKLPAEKSAAVSAVGIQADRLAQRGLGLQEAPLIAEGHAQEEMRIVEIRPQVDRPPIGGLGGGRVAVGDVRVLAEEQMRPGVSRA